MKVIAKQEGRFLIADGDFGVIVDVDEKVRYKKRLLGSILRRGYWEEVAAGAEVPSVEELMKFPSADEDSPNA